MKLFEFWVAVLMFVFIVVCAAGQRYAPKGNDVNNLQDRINIAAAQSRRENKGVTVMIPEGRYELTETLTVPDHVSIDCGRGMRPVRFVWNGPDGESAANPTTVIKIAGGYGKSIGNFEVRASNPSAKHLIFVEAGGNKNSTYHDIRVDHPHGLDCRGLVIADRESATVKRIDATCTQPIAVIRGDNHYLECLDLKAAVTDDQLATNCKDIVSVPLYLGMPKGWTIGGQNAFHGGRQAIYCRAEPGEPTGNTLLIAGGIRYEQPLSDSSRPLIEFDLPERSLEAFVVSGVVRSSKRDGPHVGWTSGKIWKRIGLDNFFELGTTVTVEN